MESRIAKVISSRGYCSRRDAEKLILAGNVKVKGLLIKELSTKILENEEIEINDIALHPIAESKIWLYYKPRGIINTRKDPQNRKTIFNSFPLPQETHLVSVGRLDINSEGLLLITNNKSLAANLENPHNRFIRVYKVRFFGALPDDFFTVKKGITIEGIRYKPMKIELIKSGVNSWCQMELEEGKNREIRKIFQHFGLQVNRLIRTSYGPFNLGFLKVGQASEAHRRIIDNLLKHLK